MIPFSIREVRNLIRCADILGTVLELSLIHIEMCIRDSIMGENGISYTLGEDGLYYPDLYLPEETEYLIGKLSLIHI